jgi:hypothetical protein
LRAEAKTYKTKQKTRVGIKKYSFFTIYLIQAFVGALRKRLLQKPNNRFKVGAPKQVILYKNKHRQRYAKQC